MTEKFKQILAELDKELLYAGVREARANLLAAEAAYERNKVEAEGPDGVFLPADFVQAQRDGEPAELAQAMEEFYMPRHAGDDLPRSKTGIADFRYGVVDVFRTVLQDQDTPDAYRAVYAQIAADQSDSGYESIPITFVDALIAVAEGLLGLGGTDRGGRHQGPGGSDQ